MGFKIILVSLLILVLWNLFVGLRYLLVPKPADRGAMVKALTFRIALSLFLFFILIVGWSQGWWNPHLIV